VVEYLWVFNHAGFFLLTTERAMKFTQRKRSNEPNGPAVPSTANATFSTEVLSHQQGRKLLEDFWECKTELVHASIRHFPWLEPQRPPMEAWPMAQFIKQFCEPEVRKVTAILRLHERYAAFKHLLASAHMRLAAHVAKQFQRRGVSYEDLVQEGVCGLMKAIDRFDLSHGTRLATYATWWIRQSLQIAVASQSHVIGLSPYHVQKLGAIQQASEALAHRWDRLPSSQELAERTGINLDLLTHLQTVARTPVSLDAVVHEGTDFHLADALADDVMTSSESRSAESRETLQLLLKNLRPRERYILHRRFGLAGNEPISLTQIGCTLRISKERVRQIQQTALKKLRTSAGHAGWESSMVLG
jgi:RNA polymerase primary sigma factor